MFLYKPYGQVSSIVHLQAHTTHAWVNDATCYYYPQDAIVFLFIKSTILLQHCIFILCQQIMFSHVSRNHVLTCFGTCVLVVPLLSYKCLLLSIDSADWYRITSKLCEFFFPSFSLILKIDGTVVVRIQYYKQINYILSLIFNL
jgi:hypothetical protein